MIPFRAISAFRPLLLGGSLALLAPAVPPPAGATVSAPDADEAPDIPPFEELLALGLRAQAEKLLRAELDAGLAERRVPYLRLLLREGRLDEATESLSAWQDSLEGEAAHFLAARIHEEAGRTEEAAREYELSAAREPLLADHAAFRAGLAWEEAGRIDEALATFETAGAAARGAGLSARAYWSAARLASLHDNPERALENLERIPSRSIIARQDLLDLEVRIYRTQGQAERERRALRELLDRAPSSEEAVAAVRRMEELERPTARDRVEFAETALQNRHAALAREQANAALAMLADDPDPLLEGAARLALGKAMILQRELTRARDELELLPDGADVEHRAEAALDRARCLWRLGQIDACLAEYDRVADSDFPKEFRATAAWEAARESKDNLRWSEAALRLSEFQRNWPDDDYADDAAWHAGRAAAEAGDVESALSSFVRVRNRYPESPFVEEAGYWIAKLEKERGHDDDACEEVGRLLRDHPDSYWTQRARETLVVDGCPADAEDGPVAIDDLKDWLLERFPDEKPDAWEEAGETIRASAPFRRGRLLAAMGLLPEAEDEMDALRRSLERDPSTLLAFAESAWRAGVTRSGMRAITVLRAKAGLPILSGETPAAVARLLYPVDHLDSVLRWSEEYGLDPLFVYAVMREESWFDPAAESWVGARGLLQIMPSTGRDLARRVGMPGFDRADLFDPDVNIRLGTFYLSALLRELDSEPALALSAYNAGKGNALRWRRSAETDESEAGAGTPEAVRAFDVDRYVAGITYRETYNYVQKVTRSWAIYRHLYGDMVPRLEQLRDGESATR
ncbi:transglycosylase SLT domain-containing protein [bacterium]|nr:transglycosylase SLT domain-containing protein [bacterium]